MSDQAQRIHQYFDAMLDALRDGKAPLLDAATSETDHALKTIKMMVAALRIGKPSQRMCDLLAKPLAALDGTQALEVLGVPRGGRPSAAFRKQQAIDTFESLTGRVARHSMSDPPHDIGDPEGDQAALVATYDAYFESEGRTYARDFIKKIDEPKPSSIAEQSMATVIERLLRDAKLLDSKPRGGARKKRNRG
jgi:hypothetical protein